MRHHVEGAGVMPGQAMRLVKEMGWEMAMVMAMSVAAETVCKTY